MVLTIIPKVKKETRKRKHQKPNKPNSAKEKESWFVKLDAPLIIIMTARFFLHSLFTLLTAMKHSTTGNRAVSKSISFTVG
ncbi:Hypothetical protein CINCED_3A018881 [Cinara cedri]|uniref:Uncharacterized protein n=1 Tax=Cinara cedri TaxID=506608 RepID=A0A5E4MZ74_9HEMI|nr:Hypothetical protein CINCED_3A018881 [Cinara cedri]